MEDQLLVVRCCTDPRAAGRVRSKQTFLLVFINLGQVIEAKTIFDKCQSIVIVQP